MPQMAPMNWIILYTLFLTVFMLINFLNYYIFMMKSKTFKLTIYSSKSTSWKW